MVYIINDERILAQVNLTSLLAFYVKSTKLPPLGKATFTVFCVLSKAHNIFQDLVAQRSVNFS